MTSESRQGNRGPTVYATLQDEALHELREGVRQMLSDVFESADTRLYSGLEHMFTEAYLRGVRDGFRDGVAAECERREQ